MKENNSELPYKETVSEQTIGNKKFIVKSVYVGSQNFSDVILKLAENKALSEMGMI